MADQVKASESGGGEGPRVAAQPETKKGIQEVKTEKPQEKLPEVSQEAKPEESKESTEIQNVASDQPKEVKVEGVKPEEVKPEEVKQEVAPAETKVETVAEEKKPAAEVKPESNGEASNVSAPKEQGDWQQRETELLKKIDELEKVKKERTQDSLQLELKVRDEEIDLLKARVKNLETELQAALSKPSGKNHEMIEKIKQQHEELLSKARGMIFDKTKMVKNQELQIEALNTQIVSLKDINQITKDLLEIRNSEIQAMEDRLQAMEARFKAEKERYGLVLARAQTSSNINDDLRKEYETQLALFKQLREKYDQRVQALVAENERLKASNPQPTNAANGAGSSA